MTRVSIFDLSRPPWKLVSVEKKLSEYRCECCNARITTAFTLEGGDGKTFVLGSTCVKRAVEAIPDREVANQILEAAKKNEKLFSRLSSRTNRPASSRQAIVDAELMLEADPELGQNFRHPFPNRASMGETLRDYINFCLLNGNKETRADVARRMVRLWKSQHGG